MASTFTPRLNPRPKQWPWAEVLYKLFRDEGRIGLLTTAIVCLWDQSMYSHIRAWLPADDRWAFVVLSVATHEIMYYGMNSAFMLCDRYGWFSRYKIPRKPSQVPDANLIWATLRASLVSHWVFQPIALYFLYDAFAYKGDFMNGPLPAFPVMCGQVAMSAFINDTLFYWSHRLLHSSWFYKRIHKQHHEYTGTIGFAAEYAHPLESFLGNQMHVSVWVWFLIWRLCRTYETHSGFSFCGSWLWKIGLTHGDGALYHDFHHTRNKGNFGVANGFWDHLCGTQDYYLRGG